MINSKKYFLEDGGIDNDSALQLIGENDVTNVQNARWGISEFGKSKRLENLAGTLLISQGVLAPYGVNYCIGSTVDAQRNYILYAIYNTFNDHCIAAYDTNTGITYPIIYDTQVVGGLGFTRNGRIDRNMYVVGDLLFYTDGLLEPKCINYIAGIKANRSSYVTDVTPYFFPIKYQSSTVIVRPPIYVLTVAKQTDASFLNNFTALNAYQFTYRYTFVNYQISALADYSALVPYNYKAETFNNVLIKIPFAEFIDNEIQQIDLCVKYGNTGNTFIIKSWNRANTQEAAQIFSHNLGNVQLQYTFYDNVVGIALDAVSAVTSFSNVPLRTKTLLPAKNRLFMFNNLMGYNTPMNSSLAASLVTAGTSGRIFKGNSTIKVSICFYDRFKRKCGAVNISVPINIPTRTYSQTTFASLINWTLSNTNALTEIPDYAYYYTILWSKDLQESYFIQGMTTNMVYATKDKDGIYKFSATVFDNIKTVALAVNLSTLTPFGIGYTFTEGDFAILYRQSGTNYTAKVIGQQGSYVLLSPTNIGTIANNYDFTLVPFQADATGDTFFLPASADLPVNNPDVIVQGTTSFALNPDPPNLGESNWNINILDGFTRTYQVTGSINFELIGVTTAGVFITGLIAVTKIPGLIGDVVYYTTFTQELIPGQYTKNINVTVTVPAGYNRVTFLLNTTGAVPSIGVKVIEGTMSFTQPGAFTLFELYTPNKENINEQYYAVGDLLNVTNPTTNTRSYATTTGSLVGDAYLISRVALTSTNYIVEAMSPNDLVYQNWQRDLGWFNTVDYIGQQTKKDSFAFSDTYIPGTKTNGLCSFQPLNQQDIGSSSGQIQKAILTNKQQEDGTVVLILTDNESLTMYLGEVQLVAAAQNSSVATSNNVIGTINELRGNSGTINPESVIQYLGEVYWVDVNNGWISQYSSNGVFPISSFKMSRFFQRYLKNYAAASTGNLDNINGFHHISMMIDPFHKRLNVVLPGLIYENYAATLPSYSSVPSYATSIVNNFDAYTELPKIMCFDFINNRWKESLQGLPEWSEYVGDKMYGFKAGFMYIHDADTANYNKFYGTQYPIRIFFTPNMPPSAVKDVFDTSVEGNVIPDFTVLYSTYPNVQITDLANGDYRNEEGVQYARFFRDRLSPNVSGTADEKLYKGDVLQGQTVQLMMEFQAYTELSYINAINCAWALSRGQGKIVK